MHEPTAAPPPPTLKDGRYVLQDQLGEGGMAVVYRAYDKELGVERAVKLVLPQQGKTSLRRRLRAEAKAMARIDHPNILAIHDVGQEGEQDFVVMTLAAGGALSDLLEHGPVSPAVACHYMVQVLSALSVAHASGIIHRDVKPHNILLDAGGRPLLADFGIALLAHDERRTRTGVAMGSVAYMPPEQRLDAARVGPEADVYACGATLYALVTGENPVDLFMALDGSERLTMLPEPLRPLILKATAGLASERYPTAGDMAEALLDVLDLGTLDGVAAIRRERYAAPDMVFSQRSRATDSEDSTVLPPLNMDDLRQATRASATFFSTPAPVQARQVVPPAQRTRILAGLLLVALLSIGGMAAFSWMTYSLWLDAQGRVAAADAAEAAQTAPPAPVVAAPIAAPPPGESVPEDDPVEAAPPPEPSPVPVAAAPAPQPAPRPVPAPAPVAIDLPAPAGQWVGSMGGLALTISLDASLSGQVVTEFGSNKSSVQVKGVYDPVSRVLNLQEQGDDAMATYLLTLNEEMTRASGSITTSTAKKSVTVKRRTP